MAQTNPTLYGKASTGKLKEWTISTDGDKVITSHGSVGGKITSKAYTAEGKNIGRSNETTPEQQAELEALAAWTLKMKRGYYLTKEEAEAHEEFTPMKCQDYKDFAHKIVFPCYAQYKLNGLRSLVDDSGDALSKAGEVYKLPAHWKGITRFIKEQFGHPLDGEVFAGLGVLSLQVINGAWKKHKLGITEQLNYYVYDIPVKNVWFKNRLVMMNQLREDVEAAGLDELIIVVETVLINNQEELDAYFAKAVADKAEGIVIRNANGLYEPGKRSYDVIKRKPRYDMEVKVFKVRRDKNGDGVLTGRTKDGVEVEFLMRIDADEEVNYRKYENAVKLLDTFNTIEYEELSDAGVPTKPVGIRANRPVDPETWESKD